ncbi:histidine phosphatase family protein [Colwellia hornerae]|uniref:histidine phosphatase family protein n=1 Tax=Colwellia hornerae TaxID=89402 RepID=UPI00147960A7|nr:histidine phosphatase family protein [Colwellia hornerae]
MSISIQSLFVISLMLLCGNKVNAESKILNTQPPLALIQALQSGGHIIYMRHGLTTRKDMSRDKSLIDLTRCETQRNLTEAGKSQVQQIGVLIKSLNIPIGQVKSSPYCRTKDTAREVFGDFKVDDKLQFSIAKKNKESAMLGQYLLDSMLASNDGEKNTVYVGHTANLKDGLGVWPKPEGVMVIFKKEDNRIIFKGMIKPDDWPKL